MTISANFPAINPSLSLDFANSKALDPRITFSRPTTATYYDNHTTAVAEQNLIYFSTTNWITSGGSGTVSANATTAPDGTSTGSSIVPANGAVNFAGYANGGPAPAANSYTISVYAKANGFNYLGIGYDNASTVVEANLSTGVISGGAGSIVSVGSGWYRVIAQFSSYTNGTPFFQVRQTSGTATLSSADGIKGIYLWGMQSEQRSSATAYTANLSSATTTNYIPVLLTGQSNEARFDHNPTTRESLGLLIEEQRTNLVTYSSDYSNAAWTKSNATVTSNTVIAPDGTQTASKLVEDTSTSVHRIFPNNAITVVSGTTYAYSGFLKAGERTIAQITDNDSVGATFDLSSGTVTSTGSGVTATITLVGNGWYRCVMIRAAGSVNGRLAVVLVSTGTTTSYTGNGFSGIYIWGAQLEAGSFPTSYIPTVASQVTRSADSASIARASWFNISQGTFYAEVLAGKASTSGGYGTTNCFIVSSNSASPERLGIYFDSGTACTINTYNGTNSYTATSSIVTAGVFHKVSAFYETSGIGMVADAGIIVNTSGILPIYQTFTNINIGQNYVTGGNFLNGYIKKIAYYPIRVTNAQLQALTGS